MSLITRTSNDGKSETFPYEGKTVLIEKKGGPYSFTIEGEQQLAGEAARALNRQFKDRVRDRDPLFKKTFPDRPVAVRETWQFDAAKEFFAPIEDEGNMDFDLERAKGEGSLVKAYKKGSQQYAVIEITMEAPIKVRRSQGIKYTFRSGAKLKVTITYEGCIDATVTDRSVLLKGKVSGTATAVDHGQQVSLTRVWHLAL